MSPKDISRRLGMSEEDVYLLSLLDRVHEPIDDLIATREDEGGDVETVMMDLLGDKYKHLGRYIAYTPKKQTPIRETEETKKRFRVKEEKLLPSLLSLSLRFINPVVGQPSKPSDELKAAIRAAEDLYDGCDRKLEDDVYLWCVEKAHKATYEELQEVSTAVAQNFEWNSALGRILKVRDEKFRDLAHLLDKEILDESLRHELMRGAIVRADGSFDLGTIYLRQAIWDSQHSNGERNLELILDKYEASLELRGRIFENVAYIGSKVFASGATETQVKSLIDGTTKLAKAWNLFSDYKKGGLSLPGNYGNKFILDKTINSCLEESNEIYLGIEPHTEENMRYRKSLSILTEYVRAKWKHDVLGTLIIHKKNN